VAEEVDLEHRRWEDNSRSLEGELSGWKQYSGGNP